MVSLSMSLLGAFLLKPTQTIKDLFWLKVPEGNSPSWCGRNGGGSKKLADHIPSMRFHFKAAFESVLKMEDDSAHG